MYVTRLIVAAIVGVNMLAAGVVAAQASEESVTQPVDYVPLRQSIEAMARPSVERPDWLPEDQRTALSQPGRFTMTYSVETRGTLRADVDEFKRLAQQTLDDPRGWSRTGARFTQVESGGQFKLTLLEASQLPLISSGCDAFYSCRVGTMVLINQDRWLGATPSWNAQKGSLRDYRHMVINHEVGHWLGHGHETCSTKGGPAAVMQQQSIDLEGCKFNPWPLESEIIATGKGGAAWDGI